MDFDNGWKALLQPGKASLYFDVHPERAFEPETPRYSPINAWWLAELSRVIYRQETGRGDGATRDAVLSCVGLREAAFFNHKATQCALVAPRDARAHPQFTVLVFRGTHDFKDWLTNLQTTRTAWSGGGRVHTGFLRAFDAVWDDVNAGLDGMPPPFFYTGHSLGAALATLAASRRPPRALYTFGSPLVGDKDFAQTFVGTGAHRVVNHLDIVTRVPPRKWGFTHVGELQEIERVGQRRLNPPVDVRAHLDPVKINSWFGRFFNPPEFLADHSPVNYVAHLERGVG